MLTELIRASRTLFLTHPNKDILFAWIAFCRQDLKQAEALTACLYRRRKHNILCHRLLEEVNMLARITKEVTVCELFSARLSHTTCELHVSTLVEVFWQRQQSRRRILH